MTPEDLEFLDKYLETAEQVALDFANLGPPKTHAEALLQSIREERVRVVRLFRELVERYKL